MIRVLLVEDDPMVSKFHEHYLSQIKGFELVDKARTGEEALECLASKDYDLILLDIFMPGMDGLQFLKQIRKKNHEVDVIVISAAKDNDRIETALRFGVVDYIIKPFEFERFNLAMTNFYHRNSLFKNKNGLEQEDLDNGIIYKEQASELSLPKGLDRNTLKTVWQSSCSINGEFTTEEIASSVGISRVSIRKYLEFLKNLRILSLELHRGAVGRPVYKYKCINNGASLIEQYF
jgi:Response regulator of citrate/malate metabolism